MIYFLSYGNDNYRNSKQRISQEARAMGFDSVEVFGPENLPKEFLEKTYPHILHPRGAGYWLWKSWLLKKTFEKMNDGDYCVYADAGCHVNIHGKKRMMEYFQMITDDESGFLAFELEGFMEKMFTNTKCLEFFNINEQDPIRDTGILVGGILFLRKCKNSQIIVDEFYKIATENPDLFSDVHNTYKPCAEFRDHRHDQSVLSLIRKKHGCVIIPDETYSENWQELIHVPILATRIRQ